MGCWNMVNINIKGKITIFNKTKNRIEFEKDNLITLNGKNFIVNRIINNGLNYLDYLAIGDGSGTHDNSSTSLFNEIFRKQVTTKSSPGNKAVLIIDVLGDEAIGSWTELGLVNEDTGGTLTNVVNVSYTHNNGEEVEVKWEIVVN